MPADSLHNEIQSKAEVIFRALGREAATPLFASGEKIEDFRKRICNRLVQYSPVWRGVDTTPFSGAALDMAERQIYADAISFAYSPASVPQGELREVIETDRTNRRISKFIGDPSACWDAFKSPVRFVRGMIGR
jgi:hypothetical protein